MTVDPTGEYDLAVVGAGIVGLATARELLRQRPGASLVVLEAEDAIARHQTSHSSGVVHAGIYYPPGSLKARLCVEGARELYDYCEERAVPVARRGKVIIALSEAELPGLRELEARALRNSVPEARWISGEELREIEPAAAGIAALHSPATGVVDFARVARALAGDVEAAGGLIATGCRISAIGHGAPGRLTIEHDRGELRARQAVFCAGLQADRLARMAGAPPDPRIVPFRGAYLRVPETQSDLVRSLIYPVPDPRLPFLGVHLSRTIDDEVLVGPTALMVGSRHAYEAWRVDPRDLAATLAWPGTRRLAVRHWRAGARELVHAASSRILARAAKRYVPALSAAGLARGRAGVRAQAVGRDGALIDDFVVWQDDRSVHVRNAPSPAATSALALARVIADRLPR